MPDFQKMIKTEGITPKIIRSFQNIIYQHYNSYGRRLPWRETDNPYYIFVSEIMLQQTQVKRVMSKYTLFIRTFPDIPSLARASIEEVLGIWQGLGYNRRAIALHKAAHIVEKDFRGNLPSCVKLLQTLPGIGHATASAICAFAFNKPTVFIETNIRNVFLYFFFKNQGGINDSEILPLIEKTHDTYQPRIWYYALMDYGVMLKKEYKYINKQSIHFKKQSPFKDSNRQIRGMLLKTLIANPHLSEDELIGILQKDPQRIRKNITRLQKEKFIKEEGGKYKIA